MDHTLNSTPECQGRILVADDDDMFADFTTSLLRNEGYYCDWAVDADSALDLLNREEYDLIIADINMPGNTKLEFVQNLEENDMKIPILLVTGDPSLDSAIHAVNLSVGSYIVKPYDCDAFLAQVRKWVNQHRLYQSVTRSRDRLGTWHQELTAIEDALSTASQNSHTDTVQTLIYMTLRNMASSLNDLERLNSLYTDFNPAPLEVDHLLAAPKLEQFRNVLRDTVGVLEKTKSAFKSKEIGHLRQKLQAVLDEDTQET